MLHPLEVIRAYRPHGGTLHGLLESRAAADPARAFLLFEHQTLSYGQFSERVAATARGLAARGIAPDDRVGVMAANSANYVVLLFALARLGAMLVPVNPEFGAREAGYILQHAGVRAEASAVRRVRAVWQSLADDHADQLPPYDKCFQGF